MRSISAILLGVCLASVAGDGVQAASAQRVSLGEVSAVIPVGCKPAKGKMGAVEFIQCAWETQGGGTETFRLSREVHKDDDMLKRVKGLGAESQKTMLSSAMPAWLNTVLSFDLPRELLPPKGWRVERQSVGKWPASGPNGMTGYCSAIAIRSSGPSGRMDSMGLYCAAVGSTPSDLLTVSAMLSTTYPDGTKTPAAFPAKAERIAVSLKVDR